MHFLCCDVTAVGDGLGRKIGSGGVPGIQDFCTGTHPWAEGIDLARGGERKPPIRVR